MNTLEPRQRKLLQPKDLPKLTRERLFRENLSPLPTVGGMELLTHPEPALAFFDGTFLVCNTRFSLGQTSLVRVNPLDHDFLIGTYGVVYFFCEPTKVPKWGFIHHQTVMEDVPIPYAFPTDNVSVYFEDYLFDEEAFRNSKAFQRRRSNELFLEDTWNHFAFRHLSPIKRFREELEQEQDLTLEKIGWAE